MTKSLERRGGWQALGWSGRAAQTLFATVIATGGLLGCATSDADETAKISDALVVEPAKVWHTREVPVCWVEPRDEEATAHAWVRSAIAQTWEENSQVRFTGWQACVPGETGGIRIAAIRTPIPNIAGDSRVGTDSNAFPVSMRLDFSFDRGNETSIRGLAVHEFGHALGFLHEESLPHFGFCSEPWRAGSVAEGPFDNESVMHTCAPADPLLHRVWQLSPADIVGLHKYYGEPSSPAPARPQTGVTGKDVSQMDCLMEWTERQYPDLFPPQSARRIWNYGHYYSHYGTGWFLGINLVEGHVYVIDPSDPRNQWRVDPLGPSGQDWYVDPGAHLTDHGPAQDWYGRANCMR